MARSLVERGAAMGVAELDRGLARSLLAEARARNEASGQRVPDGADLWLRHLGPAEPAPDLAARFPPLPEGEEREALAASGALHDLPLLRGWLPDEDFLRDVARQLDEVAVSPLYLDDAQKAAQTSRIVAQAVDRSLDADGRRALLVRRLLSIADHLERAADAAHARAAAAAARALAAGAPPAEVPFARHLVEKAFPAAPPPAPPPVPAPAEPQLIVAPR
jgi:hypothetical protein